MSSNNHLPQERAGARKVRERLEDLILNSPRQLVDSNFVSQELGITRKEAASYLREYIGSVA